MTETMGMWLRSWKTHSKSMTLESEPGSLTGSERMKESQSIDKYQIKGEVVNPDP